MQSRTHRFRNLEAGSPVSAVAVTLYVTRVADGAEMLGSASDPIAMPEVSPGDYQLASGPIYQTGETYAEHYSAVFAGGETFEHETQFTAGGAAAPDALPTWTHSAWIKAGGPAAILAALDDHIAEVTEKISTDVTADGLSASHGTLQRYLEFLHKQRPLWEQRVPGSASARRRLRARFR